MLLLFIFDVLQFQTLKITIVIRRSLWSRRYATGRSLGTGSDDVLGFSFSIYFTLNRRQSPTLLSSSIVLSPPLIQIDNIK
ncbi:hypothetical protein L1987_15891 [Smallanthus sonchifolius]|uniref:Uncharacterized protein n=1 Tax=Smallanthus sonchifolius TaxID=185202 RepID=A0ACB9J9H5_9ASTR|nr:hypothetical protein L1987_15891 [Smallanthus sonchifolius]